MNLLWLDRRKCLLLTHVGTLFPVFAADVRATDLRPLGAYVVGIIEAELASENLSPDRLGRLDPNAVQVAKATSRSVLGFMNEMASTWSTRLPSRTAWAAQTSASSTAISAAGCTAATAIRFVGH